VFVKPLDNRFFEELHSALENNQPLLVATVIRGPDSLLGREPLIHDQSRSTTWPGNEWNGQIDKLVSEIFSQGISQRIALNDETEIFFETILPPPTLIMVGGVHIAIALSSLAKTLGYRTIVIDPRKAWGGLERFSDVDQLIQAWPEDAFGQIEITRLTAIATLTHDPKLDDPALKVSLPSSAFYVGALGSTTTQSKRREWLSREGLSESQLERLHGPIGLDINAQTPEEIALAIMAEVVDAYRKRKQASAAKEATEISSL
jgi:xanthine dehydrogenase accessory factor